MMYDSGIRGASDVFKALAVGAKFVFVGRCVNINALPPVLDIC